MALGATWVAGCARGEPAADPAESPAAVAVAPDAATPSVLDLDSARERLLDLPEVVTWLDGVESASQGEARAGVRPRPDQEQLDGRTYWCFELTEERPERSQRWRNFLVGVEDGEILVEDGAGWQSLEVWREGEGDGPGDG